MLQDLIDAPSLDALAQLDPADVVHRVAGAIRGYDMPGFVLGDYLASQAGSRYIESVPYVRSYPTGLADDAEALNRELRGTRLDVLNTAHCAWEEDPGRYASITADWITRAA